MSRGDGLARLQRALEDHGCQVRGGRAQCPAHEDRDPSLSIGQGKTGAVLRCHAGCDTDAVLEAVGMSAADLFDEPREERRDDAVIATYAYTDERGAPLFFVERRAGKRFLQYHLSGDGGKVWKLSGVRRVPYRLPGLIGAARSGETVYVAEGEKDADAIGRAGGVATCNPGGAGKWRPEYARYFVGAGKVVVVADRDEPGRAHAEQVAGSLREAGIEVEVVEAAEGKDAADHLAAGHGLGDFRPAATPEPAAAPGPHVIVLADVEPERVEWLWPGYLPRGKLVILDGDPDQGKSAISLDLAARITTGSPMPDGGEPVKGAVLILSAEDGLADTIRPRLDAAGGDPERVVTITEMPAVTVSADGQAIATTRPVSLPGDLPAIEEVVARHGVILVVVDVLMAYLSGSVDAHRDQDIRRALHPLAAMAGRAGCCVLVIRHLNKTGGQHAIYRGGGSIGIVGAARAAFMVGADPEDDTGRTRVLAPVKANLSTRPSALAYRLLADELHGCVRVDWLGITDRRAADLLANPEDEAARDDRSEHDEAAKWLTGYLTDQGGEASWTDIRKEARAAGIAERTLQRAHRRVGITISRSGFPARSVWSLDPHAIQSRQGDGATGASGATDDPSLQSRQSRQQTPAGNGGASGATEADDPDPEEEP